MKFSYETLYYHGRKIGYTATHWWYDDEAEWPPRYRYEKASPHDFPSNFGQLPEEHEDSVDDRSYPNRRYGNKHHQDTERLTYRCKKKRIAIFKL
jgi:hypothetical protein